MSEPTHVVVPLTPEQMYDVSANLRTWADTVQRLGALWRVDGAETAEVIIEWANALDQAVPAEPFSSAWQSTKIPCTDLFRTVTQ